jgi:predicted MFS family arabinose efflux permease
MISADRPETRLATRLSFLVAGFGISCWAPLVPFAKARLGIGDGTLGLLLLCLGAGSVLAMLLTGVLSAKYGSRPIIIGGALGLAMILPLLSIAYTPLALGIALFAFGGSLGSIDVAMNIHAVDVERAAGRPLISGFHALFSIGGFAGASMVTALLSLGLSPLDGSLIGAALLICATAIAWPRLLKTKQIHDAPLVAAPRGIVLLLAGLAAVTFLTEGAILDWSALLITSAGLVKATQGGIGYMLFAIAMTGGRLVGDAVNARIGDRATLIWGGLTAVLGFLVLITAPIAPVAITGFVLIGMGASNIVPVLFRRAGAQTAMPSGLAVAAITTTGYAGILAGPAGIGFVAKAASLQTAFWILAGLMCLVPLCAGVVTATSQKSAN